MKIILSPRRAGDPERLGDADVGPPQSQQLSAFIAFFLGLDMRRTAALAPVLRDRVAEQVEITGHRKKPPRDSRTGPAASGR